jgi:hypothetical protein
MFDPNKDRRKWRSYQDQRRGRGSLAGEFVISDYEFLFLYWELPAISNRINQLG